MAVLVCAQIHIQATRAAVWQVFANTSTWPWWHTQISQVTWSTGDQWQDNAILMLRVSPLPLPVTIQVEVKSIVPENLVVWESRILGLTAVHVFEFADSLGGCRVREKETFHGFLTTVPYLLRRRQTEAYAQSLRNLKHYVESGQARNISLVT